MPTELESLKEQVAAYKALLADVRLIKVSVFHGNFIYTHHEILVYSADNVQVRHCGGGKYLKRNGKVAKFGSVLEAYRALRGGKRKD